MKELITECQCACAQCGEVIDYRSDRAGQTIRCPKCGEESQLPEPSKLGLLESHGPPMPTLKTCPVCGTQSNFHDSICPGCEKARRKKTTLMLLGASGVVVALTGLGIWQYSKPKPLPPPPPPPPPGHMFIAPSVTKPVNAASDFRASNFNLERSHGETIATAAGDIENISNNVHHHLRAEVDLLDRTGAKIGSVSDFFVDLGAHQTWHFVANVTNVEAMSVRFASCKDTE